ncbi:recombination protein NinG [Enterobacter hormaechei]|uniref:recombination protein NinG n=1 Tax=Enterobacter cloacae complex TaxID=354276 RepID=UPI00100FA672|nr:MULTISPECIES: recombination protein NinG [Enterobacter cloacae complex]RYA72964.1 NinG family protein [Enterobacter cloacae complex sp. 2DZ2F16B1]MCE1223900.1 recombination protein NinG [Enterobacter kobei]MEA4063650.1 recombination protein NinG [Enterobacter hormaechei]MEA4091562.1 recombination protein NinG [Enterobacter hormaechei]MEA4119965.1 recombination protein NinG [Enterobacter hormaechei]
MGISQRDEAVKKPVKTKLKVYKPKKCAHCGETFTPDRDLQKVCGPLCAIGHNRALKAKKAEAERKDKLKMRKKALQPRGYFLKKAQTAFNAFIRERDVGKACPSCGEYHPPMIFGGQWDCGHFMSVGARPELRFEEKNAYRQCKACNGGAGRFTAKNKTVHARYRETLINWYGLELVEWLEGPHEAKNYSKEDLEEIAAKYRRKTRELKNRSAA